MGGSTGGDFQACGPGGKLRAQAILKLPDVAAAIANKALEDGKKEILNSVSNITTGLIKDAEKGIKDSIESGAEVSGLGRCERCPERTAGAVNRRRIDCEN